MVPELSHLPLQLLGLLLELPVVGRDLLLGLEELFHRQSLHPKLSPHTHTHTSVLTIHVKVVLGTRQHLAYCKI